MGQNYDYTGYQEAFRLVTNSKKNIIPSSALKGK
jgi:hypothetical protein